MRRAGLILLPLVVLLLAGLGVGLALAQRRLDPETLRRAVIASVERQSGRTVSLGRIELRLLPAPHVRAQDFAIADRPAAGDAPAPDLLRIGRLSAGIGIWPLLGHVVRLDGLRLDGVVLHAVRQADGHGNWEMAPRPSDGHRSAAGGGARWGVVFDAVRIGSARLSWRDRLRHQGADLRLTSLDGSGLQGERPHLRLSGEGRDAAFTVEGEVGPIRRLFATADRRTSWPISLRGTEAVDGAVVGRMQAQGMIADPLRGRGYDLVVTASIARLSALNRLFPHAGLPEIDGLQGSAHLLDQGRPVIASLQARAGRTPVAARGLTVLGWSVSADSTAGPLRVAGFGAWRGQDLVLKGTAASLASLEAMLPGAAARPPVPAPVSLDLGAGRTAWHVEGIAGVGLSDLRLRGVMPDLRDITSRAPEIGPLVLGARLQADHGTSFRLTELQLDSPAGDLAGALTLTLHGRPDLSGTLRGSHIDLDRLLRPGAASPRPALLPGAPANAPDAEAHADANAVAHAGATPAPNRSPGALPWPLLRLADADLTLLASDVTLAGTQYRSLELHAVLQDGRLAVAPLRALGPTGTADVRLNADASATPPTLDLWMRPLMLPASVLTTWLGTDAVRGNAEVVGEIRGEGADAAALSRTAQGHLGISMVDAAVSGATLSRLIGRPSGIVASTSKAGGTAVRCIALHAALGGGQAALDTLSLRTGRLSVDGHGQVALADGTLDLHLLPDAQLGGTRLSMPVRLTGSLHDPHPGLDPAAPGGRYALQIGPAAAGEADCDASLRVAREGLAGPVPASAAPRDAPGVKRKLPKPIDVLRGLGILR